MKLESCSGAGGRPMCTVCGCIPADMSICDACYGAALIRSSELGGARLMAAPRLMAALELIAVYLRGCENTPEAEHMLREIQQVLVGREELVP